MPSPQVGLAYVALAFIALMLWALIRKGGERGLTSSSARHREWILSQLATWRGQQHVFRHDDADQISPHSLAERFRDETGHRTHVADVMQRAGGYWRRIELRTPIESPELPRRIRILLEGLLALIFGAILHVNADRWASLANGDINADTPLETLATLGHILADVVTMVLSAHPLLDISTTLLISGVMILAEWLFGQWLIISITLFVGAMILLGLSRHISREHGESGVPQVRFYEPRTPAVKTAALAVTLIWLAGVLPALGTLRIEPSRLGGSSMRVSPSEVRDDGRSVVSSGILAGCWSRWGYCCAGCTG